MSHDEGFYTKPRFDGDAVEVVKGFTAALRAAEEERVARLVAVAEVTPAGDRRDAIRAHAARSASAHIDHVERMLIGPGSDEVAVTIAANVINDVGGAKPAPDDLAGRFLAWLAANLATIADKLNDLGDAVLGEDAMKRLRATSALLRDLGMMFGLVTPTKDDAAGGTGTGTGVSGAPTLDPEARAAAQDQKLDDIWKEVQAIEEKADALGEYLGATLVGRGWHVNPNQTGLRPHLPAVPIKEELHRVEDMLEALYKRAFGVAYPPSVAFTTTTRPVVFDPPKQPFDGPPPPPPPPPPPIPPEPPLPPPDPPCPPPPPPEPPPHADPRLKKIFVYEQGVFTAAAADSVRVVEVRTAAFDLTGWLDLAMLRPGDEVTAELQVSVAGGPLRSFGRGSFVVAGLYPMRDFAGGESYLSGDHMRITIAQPRSADGFATPIEIRFQFVVESQ